MAWAVCSILFVRVLKLHHNDFGDRGATSLVELFGSGSFQTLDELHLSNNYIMSVGMDKKDLRRKLNCIPAE